MAGADEIKLHPWFAGINWALIRNQTPPYVPRQPAPPPVKASSGTAPPGAVAAAPAAPPHPGTTGGGPPPHTGPGGTARRGSDAGPGSTSRRGSDDTGRGSYPGPGGAAMRVSDTTDSGFSMPSEYGGRTQDSAEHLRLAPADATAKLAGAVTVQAGEPRGLGAHRGAPAAHVPGF